MKKEESIENDKETKKEEPLEFDGLWILMLIVLLSGEIGKPTKVINIYMEDK